MTDRSDGDLALGSQYKKQKRMAILEAAARVFARQGYAGTVIADIAKEARIGKGTIYEYFDSKDDLFFAVFDWFCQSHAAEARVQVSALAGPASERLMALALSIVTACAQHLDLYVITMEFWAASASLKMRGRLKAEFKNVYSDFRLLISSLILEGVASSEFKADVDAEAIAAGMVGALDGLFLQLWFDESFDILDAAKKLMDTVIRGISERGSEG